MRMEKIRMTIINYVLLPRYKPSA